MPFLKEALYRIISEKLSDGKPIRRFMIELDGQHITGIDCDLIETIYGHVDSSKPISEIRSVWLAHAQEHGVDRVEAEERFDMTLASFLAGLISENRLIKPDNGPSSSEPESS